ncbi:hypothetical protein Xoosp13_218 [Xanthomonas phage Xoo-sp13]|nr:hypothetical protein Xoosp13_218 [Xanthomonas phage Xoo-sp13]
MDIDIDITPKFKPDSLFKITHASIVENGELKKHNVGVYFQNIPVDKVSGLAAIPYKEAQDHGFFKIDMLNLNILDNFESKDEIRELLKIEPDWTLLEDPEVVEKLFHLAKHFETIQKIKPSSVSELADCLAIIRPNKIKLVDKYAKNKKAVIKELYTKRDPSDLRKSHAIPYALLIVLQLHLIKAEIL